MKKVALVSYHFYKTKTRGGELYVLQAAKIMAKFAKVTILTTQSTSHLKWENDAKEINEKVDGIEVRRFPVDFTVVPREINNLNHYLHGNKMRTYEEELDWMRRIGPYSSSLFEYLRKNRSRYDIFYFVGYANPITYFGLPIVKEKSILRPHLHNEPLLYFRIFDDFFKKPRTILVASQAEAALINRRFPGHSSLELIGMNIKESVSKSKPSVGRDVLEKPYILFIGRLEPSKGIYDLLEYFNRYVKNNRTDVYLYIVGEATFPIKTNKNIKYFGSVDESTKNELIKHSLFLVNPSWFESMSFTLLEAWYQEKPVLVNGFCNALRGQVDMSGGGFSYETYREFEKTASRLLGDKKLRLGLGVKGNLFYKKHYQQSVITGQLKSAIQNFPLK